VLTIYRKDCFPELHQTMGAMIKKFIFSIGVMKLGTGTNSTTRNSLVILLTSGHYIFNWSLYQLKTWYLIILSMGTILTMKIIFLTTGHLCFQMVILSTKNLVFDDIKYGYYIDHEEFIDYIFDHWSLMFSNGHFIN
jgi:hypothetical protein